MFAVGGLLIEMRNTLLLNIQLAMVINNKNLTIIDGHCLHTSCEIVWHDIVSSGA